jgi:hypothetical protein
MRRRDFIGIVGSAAAWPLTAHAQLTAMPVIGFLHLTSLETNRENLATFRQGLADTGYVEGKNVTIEYRWAQGRNDQLATLVAELVRQQMARSPPKRRPKRSQLFFYKPPTQSASASSTASIDPAEMSPASP